jgi:hypothetical protein
LEKVVVRCRSRRTAVRLLGERVGRRSHPKGRAMKYMLIMRGNDEAVASFADVDFEEVLE